VPVATSAQSSDAIVADIRKKFADSILDVEDSFGDAVVVVDKSVLHDVLAYVRDEKAFDLLLDIAGVDCLELEEYRERFELEYILYSVSNKNRLRVRTLVPDTDMDVATVSNLWQSANWAEREAYEMFGFNFVGHPCKRRLLTHDEFEGHPLRKDYPVMGGQWCSTTSDLTDQMKEEQGGAPE
jgi:NADH/F420H2 dehydrogenase subunit C